MKKTFVLIVLFALPVSIYILFATSANNFAHLPVLTKNVEHLQHFKSLDGKDLQLDGTITILAIYGESIRKMEGNAYNLNEIIYKANYKYKDVQFIAMAENGTQNQARTLLKKLGKTTDTRKWNFAFGSLSDIQAFFDSLHTDISLNEDKATPFVFIIDKEGNLRGRKKRDKHSQAETLYGYDTRHISPLKNDMEDDVKVMLAEYRLKLKKNQEHIEKKTTP